MLANGHGRIPYIADGPNWHRGREEQVGTSHFPISWEYLVQGRSEFVLEAVDLGRSGALPPRRVPNACRSPCWRDTVGTYQLQVQVRILEERLAHADKWTC